MMEMLSSLIILLTLVDGNKGEREYGDCFHKSWVTPGKKYYVYNKNFPQNYPPGSSCKWVATSDRPMKLTCNFFRVPVINGRCNGAALIIENFDSHSEQRFCGNKEFTVFSKSNGWNIILVSEKGISGGKFNCILETREPILNNVNCRCGWKYPMRIVGGTETGINEYPMMAGILDADSKSFVCGATIINEKQVLTAAHCIFNRNVSRTGVLVGDHDLTKGSETDAARLYRVDSFKIHSRYDINDGMDYDIALITIVDTIVFTLKVGPACLPFHQLRNSYDYVSILGWGTTEFGGSTSETLKKARISVITTSQCRKYYPKASSTRHLCTLEKDRDSCQFDSGGPVLWKNPLTRRVSLVGIISLGGFCADSTAAQNTRVAGFLDWIESNTVEGINYCKAE